MNAICGAKKSDYQNIQENIKTINALFTDKLSNFADSSMSTTGSITFGKEYNENKLDFMIEFESQGKNLSITNEALVKFVLYAATNDEFKDIFTGIN